MTIEEYRNWLMEEQVKSEEEWLRTELCNLLPRRLKKIYLDALNNDTVDISTLIPLRKWMEDHGYHKLETPMLFGVRKCQLVQHVYDHKVKVISTYYFAWKLTTDNLLQN